MREIAMNHNKTSSRRFSAALVPLVAALMIAGCATSANFAPTAAPAAPAAFKERSGAWTQATPAEAQARGRWGAMFADPVLAGLVERAGTTNTTFQLAA